MHNWGQWVEDRSPKVIADQVCDLCGGHKVCFTFLVGDGSPFRQCLCVRCQLGALIETLKGEVSSVLSRLRDVLVMEVECGSACKGNGDEGGRVDGCNRPG